MVACRIRHNSYLFNIYRHINAKGLADAIMQPNRSNTDKSEKYKEILMLKCHVDATEQKQ